MVVGLEPFVAAQGGMTRLAADLAWNPATTTIVTATTVVAMATISVTVHGCATTMSTMEHNIGAQLQVLLMFLLRLHLSLGSEELREEVVEGRGSVLDTNASTNGLNSKSRPARI
jgi:hypothetical protein